jgi:geranylgeranyl diphosphate synthase, type I
MLKSMQEARSEIKPFISNYLLNKKDEYATVNKWSGDLFSRLDLFMNRAKMLRGGMILVGHDLLNGQCREAALMSAAAIELVHSAFLIHDDIMDRDTLRRGEKTIYFQYEEMGDEYSFMHPTAFGHSMGICAGDEAFFLAYDLLISLPAQPEVTRNILLRFTHEMKRVGLAQMQDVEFGHNPQDPSEEEILQVYRYKTACYTFSLPLYLAAVLGGCNERDLSVLEEIGEYLGIIFQLKDDELGIYGDEATIGKPAGSDIREDKKTLFRHYLKEAAMDSGRGRVDEIFGKETITAHDIAAVQELGEEVGVRARIQQLMKDYADLTREKLATLDSAAALRPMVLEILDYSLIRAY